MGIQFHCDPDFVERRSIRRESVPMDISIRERSRSARPARMIDFNANGCRIAGNGLLVAANQLWIKLEGLESQGAAVVWCDGKEVGVSFERPLHSSVAARFLPSVSQPRPSQVASNDEPLCIPASMLAGDELLSRRERIMQGVVATEGSPLKTKKQPTGGNVMGTITRRIARNTDHRFEERFADAVSNAPMTLCLNGSAVGIDNVSASGLKVRAEMEDDIGAEIAIRFEGFPAMAGRLVWRNASEAGISLPPDSIALNV